MVTIVELGVICDRG